MILLKTTATAPEIALVRDKAVPQPGTVPSTSWRERDSEAARAGSFSSGTTSVENVKGPGTL